MWPFLFVTINNYHLSKWRSSASSGLGGKIDDWIMWPEVGAASPEGSHWPSLDIT